VDLLTEPPLRTNAKAIANQQHPDHEFGIDRWPPNVAVEPGELAPEITQLDETVYRANQMIGRNVLFQRELIKQRSLLDLPMSHHERQSCASTGLNHSPACVATEAFFNKISHKLP
jgi:hypothetical protein